MSGLSSRRDIASESDGASVPSSCAPCPGTPFTSSSRLPTSATKYSVLTLRLRSMPCFLRTVIIRRPVVCSLSALTQIQPRVLGAAVIGSCVLTGCAPRKYSRT